MHILRIEHPVPNFDTWKAALDSDLPQGTDMSDVSGWTEGWAVIVAGVLAGVVLGAVQGLVLSREIGRLRWWFLASVVGFAVGFPVVWSMGGSGGSSEYAHHALPHVLDPSGTLGGAIIGFLVGLAQWLVLRRKLSGAVWWVPASIVGFVLGWLAAVAIPVEGLWHTSRVMPHSGLLLA